MTSTNVQKQKSDPKYISTHKSSSRRDRSEKDEAIVESVIADSQLNVKEESFLRTLLNYINENKLITFIVVILGLSVIFALFIKFTSTGQNLWNKTATTKPEIVDTSLNPNINSAACEVKQEHANNNQQPIRSQVSQQPDVAPSNNQEVSKTQNTNNTQDKFEERLQFNINQAFSSAEKSQFVNSQAEMVRFVIKYLQDTDLKYPATADDAKKFAPYLISKIRSRFPKLPETEEPEATDSEGSESSSDTGSDNDSEEPVDSDEEEIVDEEPVDEEPIEEIEDSDEEPEPPKKSKKNKKEESEQQAKEEHVPEETQPRRRNKTANQKKK